MALILSQREAHKSLQGAALLYSCQDLDRDAEPVVLKLVDSHDSPRECPVNRTARLEIACNVNVRANGVVSCCGCEIQSVGRKIDGRTVFRRQFRVEGADTHNLPQGRSLAAPLLFVLV